MCCAIFYPAISKLICSTLQTKGMASLKTSRIKTMGYSQASLTATLRTWWQISTSCGLLLNWCHPQLLEKPWWKLSKVLSYTGITTSFSLVFLLTLYEFIQLLIALWKMTTVHTVIPHFVWFIYMPFAVGLQLDFLLGRQKFLSFMKDWNALESRLLNSPYSSDDVVSPLRSVRLFLRISYSTILLCLLTGLVSEMYGEPDAAYLLTHYPCLREIFGVSTLAVAHLLSVAISFFFMTLAESVPAVIFYHGALMVRILTLETQTLFTWLTPVPTTTKIKDFRVSLNSDSTSASFSYGIRLVWSQYELLSGLIGRVNRFLGTFVVINHGIKLFGICSVTYSFLHKYQTEPMAAGGDLIQLLTQVFSLVCTTLLSARLYCASVHLRTTLAALLSAHWDSVPKDDQSVVTLFLGRLQSEPLAASPLHLYQISPSLLLSIASLSMTYLVILLQSK